MKILICDDDQFYLNEIKKNIMTFMTERFIVHKIIVSTNPKTIIDNNEIYQLAFLDIQMGEIDGIALAKVLQERNSKIIIFFVTSFDIYQDDAMDLKAFRFFEKPINPDRLYSGLEKAMEYIDESYVDFFIYTDNEQKNILVDDIIYVERNNRQVTAVTKNGNYTTRETFNDWSEMLQNSFFYKVHNSYIINLHYITSYKYTELILNRNIRIPIAPRRQAAFHKFWFAYLRRR